MKSKRIDLHIHSKHSDGLLWPHEIVNYAMKRKISAISITDHDTVAGIDSALKAGKEAGIEVISGIEISVSMNNRELHLLGYFFDPNNPGIQSYNQTLNTARKERARDIIGLLNKSGFDLSMEQVLHISGNAPIGRPHIAEALVEHNYVFSIRDAFNKYLGEKKPAYVPKLFINPVYAIELIKNAGGLVFWAHPRTGYVKEQEIKELADMGIDGLETIHSNHTQRDIKYLQEMTKKYHLLQSGGSDCHGGREGGILIGTLSVPYSFLNAMKKHKY